MNSTPSTLRLLSNSQVISIKSAAIAAQDWELVAMAQRALGYLTGAFGVGISGMPKVATYRAATLTATEARRALVVA